MRPTLAILTLRVNTCADPSRRFCGQCWRAGLLTRDDRLTTASAVEPRRGTPGLLLWLKQRPGSGDGLWDRAVASHPSACQTPSER